MCSGLPRWFIDCSSASGAWGRDFDPRPGLVGVRITGTNSTGNLPGTRRDITENNVVSGVKHQTNKNKHIKFSGPVDVCTC